MPSCGNGTLNLIALFNQRTLLMRKHPLLSVVVFSLFLIVCSLPCLAQRAIVVVRHAEKIDDTDNAILSPTGQAQAKRLAHVLKDLGISTIYTTQFKRTIQTATPLADLLRIRLLAYEQTDVDGVVKEIQRKTSKGGRDGCRASEHSPQDTEAIRCERTGRSGELRVRQPVHSHTSSGPVTHPVASAFLTVALQRRRSMNFFQSLGAASGRLTLSNARHRRAESRPQHCQRSMSLPTLCLTTLQAQGSREPVDHTPCLPE